MSTHEEKINEFLKSMGFSSQLVHTPPNPAELIGATVNHMGVPITVWKDREVFVMAYIHFGFVPKVSVAPFFRRLLELQGDMGGYYFSITRLEGGLLLQYARQLEGLDFIEFKTMLDGLGGHYWQRVVPLVQEFQIPQQAG